MQHLIQSVTVRGSEEPAIACLRVLRENGYDETVLHHGLELIRLKVELNRQARSEFRRNGRLAYLAYSEGLMKASQLPDFTSEYDSLLPRIGKIEELGDVIELYNRGVPFQSLHRPYRISDRVELVKVELLGDLYLNARSQIVLERMISKKRYEDLSNIAQLLKNSKKRSDRIAYKNIFTSSRYCEMALLTKCDKLADLFIEGQPTLIIRACLFNNYSYPLIHLASDMPDSMLSNLWNEGDRINCSDSNLVNLMTRLNSVELCMALVGIILDRHGWRYARRMIKLAREFNIFNDDNLSECIQILNLSKIPSLSEAYSVGLRITFKHILDRILVPGVSGVIGEVLDQLVDDSRLQLLIYLIMTLDLTPNFNYQLVDVLTTEFSVEDMKLYVERTLQPELSWTVNFSNRLEKCVAKRYYESLCNIIPEAICLRGTIILDEGSTNISMEVYHNIVPYINSINEILRTKSI